MNVQRVVCLLLSHRYARTESRVGDSGGEVPAPEAGASTLPRGRREPARGAPELMLRCRRCGAEHAAPVIDPDHPGTQAWDG